MEGGGKQRCNTVKAAMLRHNTNYKAVELLCAEVSCARREDVGRGFKSGYNDPELLSREKEKRRIVAADRGYI